MKDEPIRILLIEDEPSFVYLLRRALDAERFRYDLIVLDDGAKALAVVRKQRRPEPARPPALIVMDLHVPKEDGIEILKAIRSNAELADLPVAVLSSSVSPEEKKRVAAFNATFISKPGDLDAFLNLGRRIKQMALAAKAS
jgi:CheY-like chemotaxis protein